MIIFQSLEPAYYRSCEIRAELLEVKDVFSAQRKVR